MTRGTRRAALGVSVLVALSVAVPAHAGGVVQTSVSSLDFANVQVGEQSAPQQVYVYNMGDAPVTVSSVSLTGVAAGSYAITNDSCSGQTLATNSIGCQFSVRFGPASAGGKAAGVAILSNGTPSRVDVALSGTGTNPALMGPSSLPFSFSVEVGRSSDVVQANYFNNGYGPVTISSVQLSGPAASEFSITQDGCSSVVLPQSGFCSVSLRLTPASPGEKLAQLQVVSTAATSPTITALSGQAHLPIQVFPSSYQFGQQTIGQLSGQQLTVSVHNSSTNPYQIQSVVMAGAHAADFPFGDTCSGLTLQSNGFCSVSVGFRPSARGARAAALTITTSAPGGPSTVSLGGVGVGPLLVVTPGTVAFGSTELGTSRTQTITIRNDGDGAGLVGQTDLVGAGASDFVTETTCTGAQLFAGSTCSFTLRYLPAMLGSSTATLRIDTNGGLFEVPVTGTAVDTTPPTTTIDEGALPVKASLLTSITGTVADAGGVEATSVVFQDALGNRTPAGAVLDACSAGNRSCAWSLVVPVLPPGSYAVRAFSRDRTGNLEGPGDTTTVLIV